MERTIAIVGALAASLLSIACAADDYVAETSAQDPRLRDLDAPGEPYRTPMAGEGFRTTVLGRNVAVPPRDRNSVSAWDVGLSTAIPGPEGAGILPFASLYFWRHPDEDFLFRAVVVGLYNEVFLAHSPSDWGPFETVLTFENLTPPVSRSELADGEPVESEELLWGYARLGLGVGYREQIEPGNQDNMRAVTLTVEPGYSFYDDGSDAAPDFVDPEDTFEGRLHLQVRWDAFQRNLLELPHEGYAWGLDAIAGYRANWEDWGRNASEDGDAHRSYELLTGYALAAGGIPGVESDRHRLIGSLHAGVGSEVDRFSAPRVGGGPQGEEFGALQRPLLPGSVINEFYPDQYAIAVAEYRFEPIFFTYVGLRGAVGYLDRERLGGGEEEDVFTSVGLRLTTGFLFETRLRLDYAYGADVIRDGSPGGHEITFHVSRSF